MYIYTCKHIAISCYICVCNTISYIIYYVRLHEEWKHRESRNEENRCCL